MKKSESFDLRHGRNLLFVAVVISISPGCANHGEGERDPDRTFQVPLDSSAGLFVVEVAHTESNAPMHFAIDTGSFSFVTVERAEMLDLEPIDQAAKSASATDAHGNQVLIWRARAGGLSIGRLELPELAFAVGDASLFRRMCPPLDGLLGNRTSLEDTGFLDRYAITIDLDEEMVEIERNSGRGRFGGMDVPARSSAILAGGQRVSGTTKWIPVRIQGRSVAAEFDTGGYGLSAMSLEFFRSLGNDTSDPNVRRYVGSISESAGGTNRDVAIWVAEFEKIDLGDLEVRNVPFLIVDHLGSDIKINQDVVRRFNLTLDFPHDRIILRRRRKAVSSELPLQLRWKSRDGVVAVTGMLEAGAAATAGVRLGDEILEWDGRRVDGESDPSICHARRAMGARDGPPFELLLRRNGSEFRASVAREEPPFRKIP